MRPDDFKKHYHDAILEFNARAAAICDGRSCFDDCPLYTYCKLSPVERTMRDVLQAIDVTMAVNTGIGEESDATEGGDEV